MNLHISIKYDEGSNIESYKGVKVYSTLSDGGDQINEVFNSGDVVADFIEASLFMINSNYETSFFSSSCDHFVMDVRGFSWFSNEVFGEMIKREDDDRKWISHTRQRGNSVGRQIWIEKDGTFVVFDTKDYGVLAMSKLGLVDQEFKTPEEAMTFCETANPDKLSYQKN